MTSTGRPSDMNVTHIPWKYIKNVQEWTSYVKVFESYHLTDKQTRPKLYTMPLHKSREVSDGLR